MNLPIGQQTSRKEFWRSHIESAEEFDGTNKEYCLKHGLNPGSFNAYRKKLGYSRPRKHFRRGPAFSEVHVTKPQANQDSSPKLPDPRWLAEFIKAWEDLS